MHGTAGSDEALLRATKVPRTPDVFAFGKRACSKRAPKRDTVSGLRMCVYETATDDGTTTTTTKVHGGTDDDDDEATDDIARHVFASRADRASRGGRDQDAGLRRALLSIALVRRMFLYDPRNVERCQTLNVPADERSKAKRRRYRNRCDANVRFSLSARSREHPRTREKRSCIESRMF